MSKKFNKKLIINLFLILTSFLLLIGTANSGTFKHTIYTPFQNILYEEEKTFSTPRSKSRRSINTDSLETNYDEFSGRNYETGVDLSSSDGLRPYCRIGGWYMINVFVDPGPGSGDYNRLHELYYCKTTYDLISKAKIPNDWTDKELLLYCNDGSDIYLPYTSKDYLTTNVNTYKGCILKNLNLDDNNTIFYGFESGNKIVDSDVNYYFDNTTYINPVIEGFENPQAQFITTDNVYRFIDARSKIIYMEYESNETFYSFRDFQENLDTNLTDVFNLNFDLPQFKLSRVALFRSFENEPDRKIFGFETASRMYLPGSDSISPVYRIKFPNFNLTQNSCENSLKRYDAVSINNPLPIHSVVCDSDNSVIINSDQLNDIENEDFVSLNLFKNIVLSAEP